MERLSAEQLATARRAFAAIDGSTGIAGAVLVQALEAAYAEINRLRSELAVRPVAVEVPCPPEDVVNDLAARFGLWPDDVREIASRIPSGCVLKEGSVRFEV